MVCCVVLMCCLLLVRGLQSAVGSIPSFARHLAREPALRAVIPAISR